MHTYVPYEQEVVDEFCAKYEAALRALFEQHKAAAGYDDSRSLTVLAAPELVRRRAKTKTKST